MVNVNNENTDDRLKLARKQALKLGNDKSKLEEELVEWLSILEKNHVGMQEALVDNDGYPRADIDVYQVRHARHKIICIRNDLKNIMQEIEKQLHLVHALSKDVSSEITEQEINSNLPIGRVASVTPNSPSDEAGLKINDLILNFGSVNCENFSSMNDIVNVVQHSINQFIKIVISRNNKIIRLHLKPHSWPGRGMLGCVILPLENVER